MPRSTGRPRRDRLRAMRFVLWAQHVPVEALTPQQISGVLGVGLSTAREWRADFLAAISPMDTDDLPPYQRPHEEAR